MDSIISNNLSNVDINDNSSTIRTLSTDLNDLPVQDNTEPKTISILKENSFTDCPVTQSNQSLKELHDEHEGIEMNDNESLITHCNSIVESLNNTHMVDINASEMNTSFQTNSFSVSLLEGFNNLKLGDKTMNNSVHSHGFDAIGDGVKCDDLELTSSNGVIIDMDKMEDIAEAKQNEEVLSIIADNKTELECPESLNSSNVCIGNSTNSELVDGDVVEISTTEIPVSLNNVSSTFGVETTSTLNNSNPMVHGVESTQTVDAVDNESTTPTSTSISLPDTLDSNQNISSPLNVPDTNDLKIDSNFEPVSNDTVVDNLTDFPQLQQSPEFKIPLVSQKRPTDTDNNFPTSVEPEFFVCPQNQAVDFPEEEFKDAAQFFKDPSSFQYLENLSSTNQSELLPRSSLYVNFDPLHSKAPGQVSNPANPLQLLSKALGNSIGGERMTPEGNNQPTETALSRESLGSNILISFDSPMKKVNNPRVLSQPTKVYSEDELQKILKVQELSSQDVYLKQCREITDIAKKLEVKGSEVEKLELECSTQKEEIGTLKTQLACQDTKLSQQNELCSTLHMVLEEFSNTASSNIQSLVEKTRSLEQENKKLKDDLAISVEDLQNVEATFSDFHKRYEQCKAMLKAYKDNEDSWKHSMEDLRRQLSEQEQKYQLLQCRTEEILEKSENDLGTARKTSEAQVAVLTAQLKKAELKTCSLESDLKQVRIENSKLGNICDDLMAKVGTA